MGLSRRRLTRDDVLRLIDSRQIQWAWDISRRKARRPEIRIWRESVLAYLARENGGGPAGPPEDPGLAQVIEAILPRPAVLTRRAATLRGCELQRRLLCSPSHVAGLIADGELCCVGGTAPRKSPVILYQSVFEFLSRRSVSI
jgi:hypothetical protein